MIWRSRPEGPRAPCRRTVAYRMATVTALAIVQPELVTMLISMPMPTVRHVVSILY